MAFFCLKLPIAYIKLHLILVYLSSYDSKAFNKQSVERKSLRIPNIDDDLN
ncbi:hypothetical protein ES705_19896 [subsurface metagenome]